MYKAHFFIKAKSQRISDLKFSSKSFRRDIYTVKKVSFIRKSHFILRKSDLKIKVSKLPNSITGIVL